MGINLVATLILPLNFVRLGPTKVGNNIQKQKVTALRQLACLRVGGGGGPKNWATWHASSMQACYKPHSIDFDYSFIFAI